MGCFFGCFRDRRTSVHLLSQPISSNPKDPVEAVARNPLSSLLLFESEDRDQSSQRERKCSALGSDAPDVDFNELKAETPVEIRNNEKLTDSESHNGDRDSSTFHSWLKNASVDEVKLEKQLDQQPTTVELFEEWENGSDYSLNSPDSCLTGQNSERIYSSSAEGHGVRCNVEISHVRADLAQNPITSSTPQVPSMQCRNKSVRFDCEFDPSSISVSSASSEVTYQEQKPSGLRGDYSASKPSPYSTPLTLTNDMQTPGTIFPSYLHNKETGKSPRISSQHVHPVLNPVENAAQLKELIAESFGSDDYSASLKEQLEERANTAEKELSVDTSLSSWLPPKKAHQSRNNRSFIGKTPGDRPIIGMVAAHWNADETVSAPPKWWDGNGIPNSTNKYKEDQKVSWHATPFEERLEKALSEDKLTAERKQLGKVPLQPIDLDEKQECKPSSHFESGFILINSS